MDYSSNSILLLIIVTTLPVFVSCQMNDSDYMTQQQRQQLKTAYDSLQNSYKALMQKYDTEDESMPKELQLLYVSIDEMRMQMSNHHNQMMNWHEDRDRQREKMMPEAMGRHIQTNMATEWYIQMKEMHDQIAGMHTSMNQQSMVKLNKRLSEQFDKMLEMAPEQDESTEIPYNEEGDHALLNGANLYAQNCASCHGEHGEGIGTIFPPLVDTKWITGDKSVPIRILLNGLSGEIEVDGQTYQGTMPSFKARLSAAEMAAILNYLRDGSEGDQPEITQEDIIELAQQFSDRTTPWRAEDFSGN